MVSFDDIHVDTRQAHWTLHGASDSRSNHEADDDGNSDADADSDTDTDAKTGAEIDTENGYATTCEMDVTGRGKKLPDILNSDTLKNKLGH